MPGQKTLTVSNEITILALLCLVMQDCTVCGTENVALCREVIMSSVYDVGHEGSMAVEGTKSSDWETCASTQKDVNPWMLFDLGNTYTISSIYIFKRTDCCPTRLKNLRFELGPTQDDLTLTHQFDGVVSTNRSFAISSNHTGRYLRIWMEDTEYLTLCEVEVYGELVPDTVIDGGLTCWSDWSSCSKTCGTGYRSRTRSCTYPSPSNGGADCVGSIAENGACNDGICPGDQNQAFGKNVTMSSVFGAEAMPSNAVNGIKSGDWYDGSCASTVLELNPWLIVDLEENYTISAIHIVNRLDCCTERLNRVHVEFGPSVDSLTEVFYQEEAAGDALTIALDGSYTGRFVKVWTETNDYLTICEIEVYAKEISLPTTTTTVSSLPPLLGETCSISSDCFSAISGSVICSSNRCSCSDGFIAFSNFICLQNNSSSNIRSMTLLKLLKLALILICFSTDLKF